MTLTLAIPTHNDTECLRRLLAQARDLSIFDRVVVVDDASDTPVTREEVCPDGAWPGDSLTILRHEACRGPGVARNRALEHVDTDHLLFFDADDQLTPDLAALAHRLRGREFDFCLFRHADSRRNHWGGQGQMPLDEAHWRRAGVQVGELGSVSPDQAAALAETANYPWNKIYRTGFLRKHGIRCSETLVHEDIELHWMSFRHGRDVLVSDRVGAFHFVAAGGQRLTNRRGEERLAVFGPLDRLFNTLAADAPGKLADAFLRFVSGLFDWIRGNIDPGLLARFDGAARDFLLTHVDEPRFARITRTDPVLARRIVFQMERGRT
ncbi:glycosyltransferase family 2 protein [Thalassovita aquimarina]|uniref:Glycosyltransferase family 2 protein n=1 Tax=Thalassovita aquimarina TaxID=2785917 RepID=A0ABS5HMG2_9RHOB|nr:glycosyltransferase family 2 protein [Thalassovita aquimarina]MBR9650077.1 glycosyltransferase family 2 protein [Thalassovita aquimarina]